ncbi:type I secretion protein [Sinorhizobium sp. BJ1]|uniref:type I secretion protein n=1 Tax=Sinorhizobium sp. BJ1 TaxID=2035455 RepID=UPI000BE9682A|nr:type I secretion protein [Sinorhizobium sp. BJ1]PDT79993.1 type I secretion protein [Sinorhizobium sp. BJ1]
MTLYFDKTTEAIAHFIGLFAIALEEIRLRDAYEEFKAHQKAQEEPPELPSVPVAVKAPYELKDFNPGIPYRPAEPDEAGPTPGLYPGLRPPEIPISRPANEIDNPHAYTRDGSSSSSGGAPEIQIDPPGSTAVYASQQIWLSDDDVVSLGGHGLQFAPQVDNSALMNDLIEAALQISPLGGEEIPGSPEEIATFINTASQQLDAVPAGQEGQEGTVVEKAETLEGTVVDGELVEEAPSLDDYLPPPEEATEEKPATTTEASGNFTPGQGQIGVEASVELEAGGNTLINSVELTNNWLQSHVLAVEGDHVELNAIIQTNIVSDNDLVSPALNGWNLDPGKATEAFNIAMFKHLDPEADKAEQAGTGGFPKAWAITEIKGDLLIMNWLEQFTLMTDEDTAILASAGSTASIITGDNTAINNVSLAELGHYYDLIFVGGSVYDANIIQQTNILLDNDLVGAVEGFGTSGKGSVSTDGNLLWNEARIVEAGGATAVKPMPESYLDAFGDLASGKKSLPDDVLQDGAFAGMNGLRVLYISGDLVNLNYVKQTNILGDSDQVALAMSKLAADWDADWTISTGSNALVNYAGIVDVDAGQTIYTGGTAYSDEILIQAELIRTEPYLGGQDPDALVSEAVAFLGEDMMAPDPGPQSPGHAPHPLDTANSDPMHSMLA